MFCPSFYLGSQEKKNYGDMAYICPLSLYYHSTAYKAYLAVYFSDDKLNSISYPTIFLWKEVCPIL